MTIIEDRLALLADCVEWSGAINSGGYGERAGKKAHRLAWEAAHGPIPLGLLVCHRCDNRKCVNVDHLFLGTVADNNRDRHAKGRSKNLFRSGDDHPATQRRGEAHWQAKLSAADVVAIRVRRADGETITALGREFGVHSATISRIARGVWRTEVAA